MGRSQPWRFVYVDSAERRLAVVKSFTDANARALAGYSGEKHEIYAGLKLAGLKEAPVHLAVFSDDATHTGSGLGQQTMPETLHYSVVAAIQTLWLAARADGIGMGWVSILDPKAVTRVLDVPPTWSLVAYLCLGLEALDVFGPKLYHLSSAQIDEVVVMAVGHLLVSRTAIAEFMPLNDAGVLE